MPTQGASRISHTLVGIALAALISAACGNSSNVSVVAPSSPLSDRCALSVKNNTSTIAAAGGKGSLTIEVSRECSWSAHADAGWISVSPAEGQGAATLNYSVAVNPDGTQRRGGIIVQQARVEIVQEAAPCRFDVSPSRIDADGTGGEITVRVTAPSGCPWSARSNAAWVGSPTPASGQGSAEITFGISANPGGARSGSLLVAGVSIVVSQAPSGGPPPPSPPAPPSPPGPPAPTPSPGCSFTISPTTAGAAASGELLSVDVTAQDGCTWTAVGNALWISVEQGQTGTGAGTVRLVIAPNGGGSQRIGTATIAGQTFTVRQQGSSCSYSIKPASYNAGRGPDDISVDVMTDGGCSWTATSPVGWAKIAEGHTGTGNGSVRILVEANDGAARSATLTIAGEAFALAQNGCATRIKPTSYNAGKGSDDIKIRVSADEGCNWTSSSPVSWVTVVDGQSGSGDGEVRLRVAANDGAARSVTLTIAGQSFTVNQQGTH